MWQMLMVIILSTAATQTLGAASSCVECHSQMDGSLGDPAKLSAKDIHFKNNLSCNSCHGGDPGIGMNKGTAQDSMSPSKGFIGTPDRRKIALLCSSCHSNTEFMKRYNPQTRVDQYTEYLTSVHGKKYQQGDVNVATCTDCHGAHGILAVADPNSPVYATNVAATCARCHADPKRMASYGIPTDQMERYSKSVHGEALIKNRDLSAPTCKSCHGNHGAAPPGVDSVANVCGQCHVMQSDLFAKSPHQKAFSDMSLPGCVTCHRHHDIARTSDAMVGTEPSSVCVGCHDKDSKGYAAAAAMKSGIVKLQGDLASARLILEQGEKAGMEVSRPLYDLSEGKDRLVLARVNVHSFAPATLDKILAEGEKIAASANQSGRKALEELAYRQKGLAVSVFILLAMIGLLLLKIRQLNAGRKQGEGEGA